ncbi:hypothetical protein [Candidatus Williamhamiltonella defendens]|uniref:hypothetical protein n=1 Tax=Candidatus Williamhamiltonella defendens TaxID=138072 RepID=UPI00074014DF|nr:hypothetical protein [Candidatus Hamiltonella defensa]
MIILAFLLGAAVIGSYGWCVAQLYFYFISTGGDIWLNLVLTLMGAAGIGLVYCVALFFLQPVIFLLAGVCEGLFQFIRWITRRIRALSVRPLP